MARVALITGVCGQDGAYLSRLLIGRGYEVHGVDRPGRDIASCARLTSLGVASALFPASWNTADLAETLRGLDAIAPDEIYNLGAFSSVQATFSAPMLPGEVDAMGALRILEALKVRNATCHLVQASSSEIFAQGGTGLRDERTPVVPRSPYAASKAYVHWMIGIYRANFGIRASSAILFNHESPLRGDAFVTRKITRSLARIAKGQQELLELGNLDARRDWGFAGDYVEGMWRMGNQPIGDDFVLASGESHSVRDFVDAAAKVVGLTLDWQGEGIDTIGRDAETGVTRVKVNPAFFRPEEDGYQPGDPGKAERDLGWRRTVGFTELVEEMMRADIDRVEGGAGSL